MYKTHLFIRRTLVLLVCFICCTFTAMAAETWTISGKPDGKFGGGSGTKNDPYLISKAQHLADLSKLSSGNLYKGKYFKMTTDIVLNDIEFGADGKPTNLDNCKRWSSISEDHEFCGIFDGDNHSISGLYLFGNVYYVGLFGRLDNAIVRNLTIKNSYLYTCHTNVCGFITGILTKSQLYNCHVVDSHIEYNLTDIHAWLGKNGMVGGLVGQGIGSGKSLTSCSFSGSINIKHDNGDAYVAGLVGLGAPTLTNCKADCKINVLAPEGGALVLTNWLKVNGLCYEAEDVTGCLSNVDFHIGAVEGQRSTRYKTLELNTFCTEAKSISSSAYTGQITLSDINNWKGKIGNVGTVKNSMNDCAFYTKVTGTFSQADTYGELKYYPLCTENPKNANNIVLFDGDGSFKSPNEVHLSKEEVKLTSSTLHKGSLSELKSDNVHSSLAASHSDKLVWGKVVSGDYKDCPLPIACDGAFSGLNGKGTEDEPFTIGSEAELRYIGKMMESDNTSADKHFKLTADIDMSLSESFEPIGASADKPFRGIFDGNGHAIIGMEAKTNANGLAGLFGYVNGTIKNLTVIGTKFSKARVCAPIACYLGHYDADGYNNYTATLTNSYAGGDIYVNASMNNDFSRIVGLCFYVDKGSTISNCYFNGKFHTTGHGYYISLNQNEECAGSFGELAMFNFGTVENCYSIFDIDCNESKPFSVYSIGYGMGDGTANNCYYVTSYDGKDTKLTVTNGSEAATRGELGDKINMDGTGYVQGFFNPILSNTKNYLVDDEKGASKRLDAIPVDRNDNIIFTHWPANDEGIMNDALLWSLPNVAVYNPADKSEYILNCTLNSSKPLQYISYSQSEATKINMHYPLALETGKSYYMLCLPGTVQRRDLPEGGKLLIGGEVQTDGDKKYINVVEADSVAGGIPFIAYVPDAKTGTTLDLVMRSRMARTPLEKIEGNGKTQTFALKGTYIGGDIKNACNSVTISSDGEAAPTLKHTEGTTTVMPFTAYLTEDGDVEIRDYMLLDEMSNETGDIIEDNKEREGVNVRLKRTFKANAWNTVCLPFAMSAAEVTNTFGEGAKVEELDKVDMDANGACTLTFKQVTDGMAAGKPYVVKPAKESSLNTFTSRTISSDVDVTPLTLTDPKTSETIEISYCGTFDRVLLGVNSQEGTEEYFVQGDNIYHATKGKAITMNGFRCYLTVKASSAAAAASVFSSARMVHGDGTTTGLKLVEVGTTTDGQRVYDLQGIEQGNGNVHRGVYIKGGRKYVGK